MDEANPVLVHREGPWPIAVVGTRNLRAQVGFDYLGVPRLAHSGALNGTLHLCEPGNPAHRRVVIACSGWVRVTREGAPTALCPVS